MDPFIVGVSILVVVVHLTLLFFLIRGSFTFHGEHVGTVTVSHTVDNNESLEGKASGETGTSNLKDTAVQTDDSDIFYTCYEHVEAQRQENLLTSEILDETVETFLDSLYNIQDCLDKNFQFLTVQLRAEFVTYLRYTLGIQTGEFPTPYNLEHPSAHNYPQIPDLVTSFYQLIEQFKNFEIKLANDDIHQQSQGGQPLDKLRPWSSKPFGRRTRSQTSFVRHRAKQDEYFRRKRQEEYRQLQLAGAIQTLIRSQAPAQASRPYAEYFTGFDTEDNNIIQHRETTDQQLDENPELLHTDLQTTTEQQLDTEADRVPVPRVIWCLK